MAYFDRHLGEGEQIILVARPSWWPVLTPMLLALLIDIAIIVLLLVVVPGGIVLAGAGLIAAIVGLALILVIGLIVAIPGIVRVLTTEIVLTDRRVASKHGWFSIAVTSTPLEKVNNINVTQSVLGRIENYGNLEVTTATAEERDNHLMRALARPNLFRDQVSEAIDREV